MKVQQNEVDKNYCSGSCDACCAGRLQKMRFGFRSIRDYIEGEGVEFDRRIKNHMMLLVGSYIEMRDRFGEGKMPEDIRMAVSSAEETLKREGVREVKGKFRYAHGGEGDF